jgi:SAM-dependent methyltransferase
MKQPSYDTLAAVYDRLQQSVDTIAWADHIEALQAKFGGRTRGDGSDGRAILLDLGCGTGSFCLEMERRGYDPIGIDHSPVMLDKAREKAGEAGLGRSLFLLQSIAGFELFGTVDLIVCLLDTINHLTAMSDVERFFALCANYLNPGGLLIFDIATQEHLQCRLGNQVFFVDATEQTLLWQNRFSNRTRISRSEILLFTREPDGRYTRSEAMIRERVYDRETLTGFADQHHLPVQAVFGGLTLNPARRTDSRHFYICKKEPTMDECR